MMFPVTKDRTSLKPLIHAKCSLKFSLTYISKCQNQQPLQDENSTSFSSVTSNNGETGGNLKLHLEVRGPHNIAVLFCLMLSWTPGPAWLLETKSWPCDGPQAWTGGWPCHTHWFPTQEPIPSFPSTMYQLLLSNLQNKDANFPHGAYILL